MRDRIADVQPQPGDHALDASEIQALLAGEVVLQRRRVDPRIDCNIASRRAVEAMLPEQSESGRNDAVAGVIAARIAARGRAPVLRHCLKSLSEKSCRVESYHLTIIFRMK